MGKGGDAISMGDGSLSVANDDGGEIRGGRGGPGGDGGAAIRVADGISANLIIINRGRILGGNAGGVGAEDVGQIITEITKKLPDLHLSSNDLTEVMAALTELHAKDASGLSEPSKVRQVLGRVVATLGRVGESVLVGALKNSLEVWMKQHGI
jgi:hypothetical protein